MKISIKTLQGKEIVFNNVHDTHLRVEIDSGIEIMAANCYPTILESSGNNVVVISFEKSAGSFGTSLKFEVSAAELVRLKEFFVKNN